MREGDWRQVECLSRAVGAGHERRVSFYQLLPRIDVYHTGAVS